MDRSREPARLQFSIRALLWITLVAAVLSALAAPVVRNSSAELWQAIALSISAISIGFLKVLLGTLWSFRRAEGKAGDLLYVTPQFRPYVAAPHPRILWGMVFLCVMAFLTSFLHVIAPRLVFLFAIGLQYGQPVAMLMLPARFGALYRMHENGVVWSDYRFVQWDNVRVLRWRRDTGWLAWSLNGHYTSFDIPEYDRELVDGILQEYCAAA